MILSAYNPSTDNLEKSYLSRDYSVGVISILVRNNDRFNVNDRILIGEMGAENSEIVTVGSVNSDKVTVGVGATKFPHSASDPVYVLRYDQIKFYRSTTTIDGSYVAQVTVNMDVDNGNKKTMWNDPTGLSSYFYKITFYHSQTSVESEQSNPIPGEGYSRKQVGTIVNDFLTEVGDLAQEYMTVPQILALMNDVNDDLIGQSRRPYRFLSTSEDFDIESGNPRIPLPSNLVKFDRVRYTRQEVVGETKGNLPIVSIEELEYYDYEQNVVPSPVGITFRCAAIDYTTNELVLYQTPTKDEENAIRIYYWKEFNVITDLSDAVETPVAYIYKLFLLSRYYRIRAKKEDSFLLMSREYQNDYNVEIVKLQRAQKVDVGTPPSFQPDTRTRRGLRRN